MYYSLVLMTSVQLFLCDPRIAKISWGGLWNENIKSWKFDENVDVLVNWKFTKSLSITVNILLNEEMVNNGCETAAVDSTNFWIFMGAEKSWLCSDIVYIVWFCDSVWVNKKVFLFIYFIFYISHWTQWEVKWNTLLSK